MNETKISNRDLSKMLLALGVGITLIYLAFLKPGIWGHDGNDMLQVSISLITKGSFALPDGLGVQGADGQYYSVRYPLLSIVAIPFTAVGLVLASVLGLPVNYVAGVCVLVLSVLLTAGCAVFVALIALRLGSKPKLAYLAALSYAFGTVALVYSREFFAEPLLSFLTAASLYLILGQKVRSQLSASLIGGLAITAKPAAVVIGPPLSIYLFAKKRPWYLILAPLVSTAMGMGLYFSYNYLRFGDWFSSGQDGGRFGPAGFGPRLFGQLFGFGAGGGLIWYCPPVILAVVGFYQAVKHKKTLEALVVVAVFCGFWLLHGFWRFEGWSWGPRFIVPTLPGLMALAALAGHRWKKTLLALTLIGFLASAPSLVSFYQRHYAEASDAGIIQEALELWIPPAQSPLIQSWGAGYRQVQAGLNSDVANVLKDAGAPPAPGSLATSQLLQIVAVWWWVLPAAGIPLWIGFVIAIMLIASGVWLLMKGWGYASNS